MEHEVQEGMEAQVGRGKSESKRCITVITSTTQTVGVATTWVKVQWKRAPDHVHAPAGRPVDVHVTMFVTS